MPLLKPGTALGRYTVLGKLATGGMSEIYLARQSGPAGFAKVVVLKVILPHLADDPSFMQMFLNEAKLAALLNHPNVVQIFDFGEAAGQTYIAMEYIDGQNLRGINRTLRRQGLRIPREIAVRIIADICGALAYAHGMVDTSGQQLNIIHRDVSLENILVTYSGQVKLVDFGVAKATILESYTSEGTLKGKYGYMAPELIRGEPPDHRLDIFALGVVMYSALLGSLPFKAKNHAQILEQILHRDPRPPRERDPDLPEELERIVLRALHKQRSLRYQHAGELQAELEQYLLSSGTAVMPFHLAQFMAETFPPGTDEDRATYQQIVGAASGTPSRPRTASGPDTPRPSPSGSDPLLHQENDTLATPPPGAPALPTAPVDAPGPLPDDAAPTTAFGAPPADRRPARRTRLRSPVARVTLALLGAGAVVLGAGVAWHLTATPPMSTGPALGADHPVQDATRADAANRTDTAPPTPDAAPPPDAPPARPDLRASPPREPLPPSGLLSATAPTPAKVLLDGKLLGRMPLASRRVPAGRHRLTLRSRALGYRVTRWIVVRPGAQITLDITPRKGRLRILVRPWARVSLDGKPLGVTPLAPVHVYEGPHTVVLENKDLRVRKRRHVHIQPGRETVLKVRMD